MSLKNPVTPPGIDPGTVRLVAQRINHYATSGPFFMTYLPYYYYYFIIVSFMQGSHTHIPETNHVPRGYIVAAILSLFFMVPLCLVPALLLLLLLL